MKRGARIQSAVKVKEDGYTFDSKREHRRYLELKLLVRAESIFNLDVHTRIPIIIAGVPIKIRSAGYPNGRQLTYVADFHYFDAERGVNVIEDCKGHRTDVYKIKRALVEAMGLEILET